MIYGPTEALAQFRPRHVYHQLSVAYITTAHTSTVYMILHSNTPHHPHHSLPDITKAYDTDQQLTLACPKLHSIKP